jgi:hypothetical protein
MPEMPEIDLPDGFGPPQGTEPGQDYEAVVVLREKPNGKTCVVSLDGSRYQSEDDDYDEEEEVETTEEVVEQPAGPDLGFANRLMQ